MVILGLGHPHEELEFVWGQWKLLEGFTRGTTQLTSAKEALAARGPLLGWRSRVGGGRSLRPEGRRLEVARGAGVRVWGPWCSWQPRTQQT